jgi:hypothetical protein
MTRPSASSKHAPVPVFTEKETHSALIHPGNGWHYQADEVARCVRDGKLESERMPLEESRIVQGWFDTVRRNGSTTLKNLKGEVA